MCRACIYFFFDKQTRTFIKSKHKIHHGEEKKDFLQSKLNSHKCLKHILLKDEQAYCLAVEHERNEHYETQDLRLIFHTPQVPLKMELEHSHTKIEQFKRVTLQNKVQNTNFFANSKPNSNALALTSIAPNGA